MGAPASEAQTTLFREADSGDEELVFSAYSHSFEGDVDARAPESPSSTTWNWRQSANPAGSRVLLGLRDERVVSLISGSAQRMLIDGEPALFSRIDDMRVAPEVRRALGRPGLVVRTGRAYASTFGGADRDVLVWGFPTPAAWRVCNWHMKADVVRTQFKLIREAHEVRIGSAAGVDVQPVTRFDEDVDQLFARFAEGKGAVLVRDAAFLNWRFLDRPDHTYECAVARRGGELVGASVFRRGDFDGDAGVGLVCDWMVTPDDEHAANALLGWLVERADASGCEQLVSLIPESSPDWRLFHDRADFLAVRLKKRFFLAFRPFTKRLRPHWLYDRWHYTLADTDFC